jgi:hypothetical protein
MDDVVYRFLRLEGHFVEFDIRSLGNRVGTLEEERGKDQRTIKELEDEIFSRKSGINDGRDNADEKVEGEHGS